MDNPLTLTKETALRLMETVCGITEITDETNQQDIQQYRVHLGTLEITCENDWFDHCGLYRFDIRDLSGAGTITMYFDPETLERNLVAEASYKAKLRTEARIHWVHFLGPEEAHRCVDVYWRGV